MTRDERSPIGHINTIHLDTPGMSGNVQIGQMNIFFLIAVGTTAEVNKEV